MPGEPRAHGVGRNGLRVLILRFGAMVSAILCFAAADHRAERALSHLNHGAISRGSRVRNLQ